MLPTPGAAEVVVRAAGRALGAHPEAEIAGQVVAAGEAAAEWLGRRVVVPRLLPCGDCDRCRRGFAAGCPQRVPRRELGEYEQLPARFLCALDGDPPLWPTDLEPGELWRAAALADCASAPYAALSRAGLGPGERVAILGGGPRALFACAIARAKGALPVAIADPARNEALLGAGAQAVLDHALSPDEAAEQLGPAPVVLETTGGSAGRHRALAMLAPGATAVFLDGPTDALKVPLPDWPRFVAGESRLLGAEAAHPDLFPELCALFARGELPLASLVTAIEPAGIDAARAAVRAGTLHQLPVIRFPWALPLT